MPQIDIGKYIYQHIFKITLDNDQRKKHCSYIEIVVQQLIYIENNKLLKKLNKFIDSDVQFLVRGYLLIKYTKVCAYLDDIINNIDYNIENNNITNENVKNIFIKYSNLFKNIIKDYYIIENEVNDKKIIDLFWSFDVYSEKLQEYFNSYNSEFQLHIEYDDEIMLIHKNISEYMKKLDEIQVISIKDFKDLI